MKIISNINELAEIYGQTGEASLIKEIDFITPAYRAYIEASPFMALATVGPEGLDCSPRGDAGNVVHIRDEKTVILPDRRGNNRIDSLANIVRDPRVALLFLVPGSNTTLRINGRAIITDDPSFCAEFAMEGKLPRTITIITVESIYFQCARALMRAGLWNANTQIDPKSLPTPGQIMGEITSGKFDGKSYDEAWPERAAKTMW